MKIANKSIVLSVVLLILTTVFSISACASSTEDTITSNITILYALAIMVTIIGLAFAMSGSISINAFISIALIAIIGIIAIKIITGV